jgi:hypothetical protein
LRSIKPTTDSYEVPHSKKIIINSPYKLDIDNSLREIRFNLQYECEFGQIWLQCPINLIQDWTIRTSRKVYETEHVHFLGQSKSEIGKISLPAYHFKANQVSWYGGNVSLVNEDEIKNIINYLTNEV